MRIFGREIILWKILENTQIFLAEILENTQIFSVCKGKSFKTPDKTLSFCPYRAQGGLRLYPGCYPGLGASAPSGRVGQGISDIKLRLSTLSASRK